MEWVKNVDNISKPLDACNTDYMCPCRSQCKKNKGFCPIEVGGPKCPKRGCLVYIGNN